MIKSRTKKRFFATNTKKTVFRLENSTYIPKRYIIHIFENIFAIIITYGFIYASCFYAWFIFIVSLHALHIDIIWDWMNNNNLSFACEWRFELKCQCFATQRDFKLIIHTKWDEVVFSFFSNKKNRFRLWSILQINKLINFYLHNRIMFSYGQTNTIFIEFLKLKPFLYHWFCFVSFSWFLFHIFYEIIITRKTTCVILINLLI